MIIYLANKYKFILYLTEKKIIGDTNSSYILVIIE